MRGTFFAWWSLCLSPGRTMPPPLGQVLPGFQAAAWHDQDVITTEDREDWLRAQSAFVVKSRVEGIAKGRPKRRAAAKLQLVRPRRGDVKLGKERRTSAVAVKALDNIIRLSGLPQGGLVHYSAAQWSGSPFASRPLLVTPFDECSANLSWANWLAYSQDIRIIAIRDIYHREWNDAHHPTPPHPT